ncbi:lipase member H-A [Solenopsis invicta]|uniref:lipase member H-A n=1 Tax=Solenopsis invicta TaxID=13686 RepID=UPI0005959779|nr:lipase member H-A [Solenopsis invicta]XP_039309450.1 lipase member H-A [Solenopsis invicta]
MLTSTVYYHVLLLFMAKIIPSQSDCSCNLPKSDFATDVNLLYYKCNNEIPSTIAYPIITPENLVKVLEPSKQTIFYVFGYTQSPENNNVQLMIKALCYGRTDNIVLLDWSRYSSGFYMTVFKNAEKIGRLFAKSIENLVNSGLDVTKIYIVAHSLGAHIAGFAGKCNKNFKIPRITGLDPANRIFYPTGCYLTSKDASWIDVIHTDMGGYGTSKYMGTAEFYANTGHRPQPGCPLSGLPLSTNDFCSHGRSAKIYAKSKISPAEFIAKRSFTDPNYNNLDVNQISGVGYAASNVTGFFNFKTGIL